MSIKEDIEKVETKMQKIEEEKESFAMELLQYSKEQNKQLERVNKRLINVVIFVLILFGVAIGYLVWLLNDIEYVDTKSIEIEDVEQIDNSHIKIGDDIWELSE